MTFSICVRESHEDREGNSHVRFGNAITTRVASVGMKSPYVTRRAAVCAQAGGIGPTFTIPNIELRKKATEYIEDGVAIQDAFQALMAVDDGKSYRQAHGVDADNQFAFTGEDAGSWAGHRTGENFTVAGNLLVGEEVVEEVARAYEAGDPDEPLSKRLIEAIEAGHEVGGDKRTELPVHSAAIRIKTTEEFAPLPFHHDFRVDATETPFEDLWEVYDLVRKSYEMIGDGHYEDDIKQDRGST